MHEASSTGEFTRGMELMARRPMDQPVFSGLDPDGSPHEQDDYLMRLLQPRSASNPEPTASQPPAPASLLPAAASVAPPPHAAQGLPPALACPALVAAPRAAAAPWAAAPTWGTLVKAALGAPRYAQLRARMLEHQDTFLQQIFDLHRCVRRQRQLVAASDDPQALAHAVTGFGITPLPAPRALSPAALPACLPQPQQYPGAHAAVAQHPACLHPLGPKPAELPPAMPFGAPLYCSAPQGPALDPMSAWYTQHYSAYVGAVMPATQPPPLRRQQPTVSVPVAAPFARAHTAPVLPVSAVAAAAGQSAGARWWQDPGQVINCSLVCPSFFKKNERF